LRIRVPTLAGRAEVEEAVKRAEGIQDALWAQAAALADRPTMALAGFLQSLTELSDLQVKRVRAAVSPSRRSCRSSRTWSGRGRSCSPSRRSRSWTWPAASLRLPLLQDSDRRLA
jgi:DNA-binding protein H-NS